jgi:hypothetical protein
MQPLFAERAVGFDALVASIRALLARYVRTMSERDFRYPE